MTEGTQLRCFFPALVLVFVVACDQTDRRSQPDAVPPAPPTSAELNELIRANNRLAVELLVDGVDNWPPRRPESSIGFGSSIANLFARDRYAVEDIDDRGCLADPSAEPFTPLFVPELFAEFQRHPDPTANRVFIPLFFIHSLAVAMGRLSMEQRSISAGVRRLVGGSLPIHRVRPAARALLNQSAAVRPFGSRVSVSTLDRLAGCDSCVSTLSLIGAPFGVVDSGRKAYFYDVSHRQSTVPILHLQGTFAHHRPAHCIFQMIDLPLVGGKWSLVVLLPDEPSSTSLILPWLTIESLDRWLKRAVKRRLRVSFPVFKARSDHRFRQQLDSLLKRLGIGHREQRLRCVASVHGTVIHQAAIEVGNSGSSMSTAWKSDLVPKVHVNRAFLFFVRHRRTGLLLAAGRIQYPDPGVSIEPVRFHLGNRSLTLDPDRAPRPRHGCQIE